MFEVRRLDRFFGVSLADFILCKFFLLRGMVK